MKHGKNYVDGAKLIDRSKLYESAEALDLAVQTAKAKFDESKFMFASALTPAMQTSRFAVRLFFRTAQVKR